MLRKIKSIFSQGNFNFNLSGLFDNGIIEPSGTMHPKADLCLKTNSMRRKCASSRKDVHARRIENGFAK